MMQTGGGGRGRRRYEEEEWGGGAIEGREEVLRDKSHLPHCYRSYTVRRKTIPVILVYDTYQTIFAHNIVWGFPTCQINRLMCCLLVGRWSSEESVVRGEKMQCVALCRMYIWNARGYRCAGS